MFDEKIIITATEAILDEDTNSTTNAGFTGTTTAEVSTTKNTTNEIVIPKTATTEAVTTGVSTIDTTTAVFALAVWRLSQL